MKLKTVGKIEKNKGRRIGFYDTEGRCHREDEGPAVMLPSGARAWYKHGKCHRKGRPALVWGDGQSQYVEEGVVVRDR